MEIDALGVYVMRKHKIVENGGLSNIYGEAPNAINAAKDNIIRMLEACEKDVPDTGWLMGKKPSCADIMFMSCLQVIKLYNIDINSKKILSYYDRSIKRPEYIKAMIETYEYGTLKEYKKYTL